MATIGVGIATVGLLATSAQAVRTVNPVRASCIQSAVNKRETAGITAYDTYHTTVRNALGTRQTALKDAWGKTTISDRKKAVNNAWKTFRNSRLESRKTFKASQKSAWDTFKDEQRDCNTASLPEDNAGQKEDGLI